MYMYILLYGQILGGIPKMLVLCNFLEILMVSDKTIHKAFWSHVHVYGTGKKKRPSYLVGNLVATNWPIEKAMHAIGYNQIPTK